MAPTTVSAVQRPRPTLSSGPREFPLQALPAENAAAVLRSHQKRITIPESVQLVAGNGTLLVYKHDRAGFTSLKRDHGGAATFQKFFAQDGRCLFDGSQHCIFPPLITVQAPPQTRGTRNASAGSAC